MTAVTRKKKLKKITFLSKLKEKEKRKERTKKNLILFSYQNFFPT